MQQCRQQQEPTEASQAFTPNRRRNPRRLRRGGCQFKDIGMSETLTLAQVHRMVCTATPSEQRDVLNPAQQAVMNKRAEALRQIEIRRERLALKRNLEELELI